MAASFDVNALVAELDKIHNHWRIRDEAFEYNDAKLDTITPAAVGELMKGAAKSGNWCVPIHVDDHFTSYDQEVRIAVIDHVLDVLKAKLAVFINTGRFTFLTGLMAEGETFFLRFHANDV